MQADERTARGSIVVGPGERLSLFATVVRALGRADVAQAGDVEELSGSSDAQGLLVLDAEEIAAEDLGYVRRFLDRRSSFRLMVVGDDPSTRVARGLLARRGASWLAWPPDLDDLAAIAGRAGARSTRTTSEEAGADEEIDRPRAARPEPARSVAGQEPRGPSMTPDSPGKVGSNVLGAKPPASSLRTSARAHGDVSREEMSEIQSILEGNETSAAPANSGNSGNGESGSISPARPDDARPEPRARMPRWWRDQIADLADAAQRIELGTRAVRDAAGDFDPEAGARLDALDAEVARLVQFARTLACVAAPPPRGEQTFDLTETLQLFVTQLANRGTDSPRCQFRAGGKTFVRSDRALLGTALDAFFYLAGACSSKGELVRLQVRRAERLGEPMAEVRLEFPAGPLASTDIARILEPYGVRRILPALGPNALAAAIAIVEGQGGSATLGTSGDGRLEWRIELPAVAA